MSRRFWIILLGFDCLSASSECPVAIQILLCYSLHMVGERQISEKSEMSCLLTTSRVSVWRGREGMEPGGWEMGEETM